MVVITPVIAQLQINKLVAGALSIFRWIFLFLMAVLVLSAPYPLGLSRRPAK
jgi:hypothetical protein